MSRFKIDPWRIIEDRFDLAENEIAESVFTLANEYMGTRGTFEEGLPEALTHEGQYLAGIFVKEPQAYVWKRNAFPDYANSIINTTNWMSIKVVVDGEALSLDRSRVEAYERILDMRHGVLQRKLIFETASGARTALVWERFIHCADRHAAAVLLTVEALNHTKPVELTFALDARRENRNFARSRIHQKEYGQACEASDMHLLMRVLTTGQYYIHQMAVCCGETKREQEAWISEDRYIGYRFTFQPEPGRVHRFEKLISAFTSRDAGHPLGLIPKAESSTDVDAKTEEAVVDHLLSCSRGHSAALAERGYATLRETHQSHLIKQWDELDISIEDDPAAQQGIRYSLFQLMSTYRGRDSYQNIAPKGFSGENYEGRTFWDTESYGIPFYLFTNPAAARALIEYRHNHLDAARARARQFNYAGAMYPMMTIDGTEDCSVWEYSFTEIHLNTTIVYAVYLYDHCCGDTAYVYTKGAEVVFEIAKFWASRVAYIPYRKGYGINRVTGPDEWQQWVTNNFYTNYMAAWVLRWAAELYDRMAAEASDTLETLREQTGVDSAQVAKWRHVADHMILNRDEELDIFVQDDMYLSLDPIARETLDRDRDLPVEAKWTVEKYLKFQMSKQPDVLLAMFLWPNRFTEAEKRSNYRFYEQRCGHNSSLSPCIHSIMATQIGRYNQAYRYYLWAARLDLDNRNNDSELGLHISSMAGSWLNIVCGFGGLVYTDTPLRLAPILPPGWTRYTFRLKYRNAVLEVGVDEASVQVHVREGDPVSVQVYDDVVTIDQAGYTAPLTERFTKRPALAAVIFDLDGVVTDTAAFHYRAWKSVADEEGIPFDEQINERLKGVSRMDSLKIIMEQASRTYSEAEMDALATRKNERYVRMLEELNAADVLEGIPSLLDALQWEGRRVALCSASRNADLILTRLGLRERFDVIVTGHDVTRSKPDPEGLILASERLGADPATCVVVEDAAAGVEAASLAGMKTMGIGDKMTLHQADYCVPSTRYLTLHALEDLF